MMGKKTKSPKVAQVAQDAQLAADVDLEMKQEREIPSSTEDPLSQLEGDMNVDVQKGAENPKETLLQIRREVEAALSSDNEDEDEEEEEEEDELAPPSSQPRPISSDDEDADDDSFEGEFSYADLSENFSAQDADEDAEGEIALEAFAYDPADKEFMEELLAVAPKEERDELRRLSVALIVDEVVEKEEKEETSSQTPERVKVETFARAQPVWRLKRDKNSKSAFNTVVFGYASGVLGLEKEGAVEMVKVMDKIWAGEPHNSLRAVRGSKGAEKKQVVAVVKEEKAVEPVVVKEKKVVKAKVAKEKKPAKSKGVKEEEKVAETVGPKPTRRAGKGAKAKEKAKKARLLENKATSTEQAIPTPPLKRKRSEEVEEVADSATRPTKAEMAAANPTMSKTALKKQRQREKLLAEVAENASTKLNLVEAQDWYAGDEPAAETVEVEMPPKKKAKKEPTVSAHFPVPSAKAVSVVKATPAAKATLPNDGLDMDMVDVPAVVKPILKERDSSIIGTTADDEDRPITFSGGTGSVVERVLRTQTITEVEISEPMEIDSNPPTTIIPASKKAPISTAGMTKKQKKQLANEENRLKQLAAAADDPIKRMAKAAKEAVKAAGTTVEETVKQNETLRKPKKEKNSTGGRTKRARNNNRAPGEGVPGLSGKRGLTGTNTEPLLVENKIKMIGLKAKQRDDNDPVIVAQRLADGLHANGKRKRNRAKKDGPSNTSQEISGDALATRADANSEKPNIGEMAKGKASKVKGAVKVEGLGEPKEHHS